MLKTLFPGLILFLSFACSAQEQVKWGDQQTGGYVNPILPADFQNTDVIRVGSTFYYISATKELSPGMMILSSADLVNWKITGHAVPDLTSISQRYNYDKMEGSSRGIWAGAIRYHSGRFYICFTDPDFGLFMTSAKNAAGPWSPLIKLIDGPGWDDPCPFWDDDGSAWLVATDFADKYKIHLFELTPDGSRILPGTDQVIHQGPGSEASKLYKINGYYYHFYSETSKEGRIPFMARARSITGPYTEIRQLIHRADREPNQGGLVQIPGGDWYFITHHGKAGWEGREVSLLPVTWTDGWPVWGTVGADGIGNMVWDGKKPLKTAPVTIQTSDDFSRKELSPQWEWYFQPRSDKWSLTERPGFLRLYAGVPLKAGDISKTTNVLTQRPFRIEKSIATVKIDVSHMQNGQTAGLSLFGKTQAAIGIQQVAGTRHFYMNNSGAIADGPEVTGNLCWLQASWNAAGAAQFLFSTDGTRFQPIGGTYAISNFGNFLGAKIGLFTAAETAGTGFIDIDSFTYPLH